MRACVDGRETDDDIEVTTEGIFWKEFAINMESLNNQIHNLSMETGGIPNGLNTNFNFPLDLYKSERKRLVQNLPKLSQAWDCISICSELTKYATIGLEEEFQHGGNVYVMPLLPRERMLMDNDACFASAIPDGDVPYCHAAGCMISKSHPGLDYARWPTALKMPQIYMNAPGSIVTSECVDAMVENDRNIVHVGSCAFRCQCSAIEGMQRRLQFVPEITWPAKSSGARATMRGACIRIPVPRVSSKDCDEKKECASILLV